MLFEPTSWLPGNGYVPQTVVNNILYYFYTNPHVLYREMTCVRRCVGRFCRRVSLHVSAHPTILPTQLWPSSTDFMKTVVQTFREMYTLINKIYVRRHARTSFPLPTKIKITLRRFPRGLYYYCCITHTCPSPIRNNQKCTTIQYRINRITYIHEIY